MVDQPRGLINQAVVVVTIDINSIESAVIQAEVMDLLDQWITCFNRRDLAAWLQLHHFPHYRLAGGRMTIWKTIEVVSPEIFEELYHLIYDALLEQGWHHSQWNHQQFIHTSAAKVHVDVGFTRYREDGSVLGSHSSLYIITKEHITKEYSRWGVKLRSSYA